MSSIPPLNSYSGVPEYTVNYTSEHPPLAFPSLNNSVAINLCLDDTPDFLNSPKLNKAKLPNETAIPIPTEGEFFFVPQGFVPILIVESITSVIEYNFPPEVIPLTQPNFSTPIYPIPSAATFAPIPSIKKIHPATSTLANTKEKHLKVKKAPRPTNAFILFRRENHGRIFQQSPHLSNNDVSKTLGKEWKELPEHEKDKYRIKAKNLQQEHQNKYPDYRFTPQTSRRKRVKPEASELDERHITPPQPETRDVPRDTAHTQTGHNPFHILYIPQVGSFT